MPEENSSVKQAQEQFILEWGRMSSSWGINRTMAQIHALLFVSNRPLEVNEIMERLGISRGNASMNLRDLMDWGLVRRFRHPGDRKDAYSTETDPWQMFSRVVKERKRREIDPTVEAIRECMTKLPESDMSEETIILRARLRSLVEIFELVDLAFKEVFSSDDAVKDMLNMLKKSPSAAMRLP